MKYQLTCPKCNYEFQYDGGKTDAEIEGLKVEITELIKWLADYKLMSKPKRNKLWRDKQFKHQELAIKNKRLQALKAKRKVANEHIKRSTLEIFAQLVKDEIGEKRYIQLMEKAKKELEAYRISSLMMHKYTRANSKDNVININKL